MELSAKYEAFVRHDARVEVLEGTTYAGKTTVGIFKWMLCVAQSSKRYHVIAGLDLGTLEKNIINPDLGVIDLFGGLVSYQPNGGGGVTLPHITYRTSRGVKIIYTLGYDNKTRWKKALGGQYGCVFVDEANVADMDFIREVSIRYDYLMMTLNPDDPDLPVYAEYINHCRPLPEWAQDVPAEMMAQLNQEARAGWTHWYFTFDHNPGLSDDKRLQLQGSASPDSKLYKNKILGLRGRATGLVFALEPRHVITVAEAKAMHYTTYTTGVDTAYSQRSADTFAFLFAGITADRKAVVLAERVLNNRDMARPLSPSDIPLLLVQWAEQQRKDWGFARDVYVDSADQATLLELRKYAGEVGCLYSFVAAHKKTPILDRINLQIGWMARGDYLVVDRCKEHIRELNLYSWREDKSLPEDAHDHTINAAQYAWLPYKTDIGRVDNARRN